MQQQRQHNQQQLQQQGFLKPQVSLVHACSWGLAEWWQLY
jgi:hypothetical protein